MHPVMFQLGHFTVYTYGFFTALAVVTALVLAARRAARFGLGRAQVADVIFVLFVSGVLGARVFYVFQHAEDYSADPWRVLFIQEGGLVWYGGFMAAVIAGLGYAAWRRMPVLKLCDFFAPILAIAHAIGRLGCFFNGCCYGRVFGSWSVPVQLLESALLVFLAAFLFARSSKKRAEGDIFFTYLLGYSMLRFFTEFLRGDQPLFYFLTLPQWTSVVLFLAAVFFRRSFKSVPPHRPA